MAGTNSATHAIFEMVSMAGLYDPSDAYTIAPATMRAIRAIESSGDPNARTGKYKGLYQLSDDEFQKYGGRGSIFDPDENTRVAGLKLSGEVAQASRMLGRDLTPAEQYLVHQQGVGGAVAHLQNPDQPAWQSMASTGEGREKGPGWARQAIWGNIPNSYKAKFGDVDNVTSGQFADMWRDRFARALGQNGGDNGTPSAPIRTAARTPSIQIDDNGTAEPTDDVHAANDAASHPSTDPNGTDPNLGAQLAQAIGQAGPQAARGPQAAPISIPQPAGLPAAQRLAAIMQSMQQAQQNG